MKIEFMHKPSTRKWLIPYWKLYYLFVRPRTRTALVKRIARTRGWKLIDLKLNRTEQRSDITGVPECVI